MQAALSISPTLLPLTPSKNISQPAIFSPNLLDSSAARRSVVKATAVTYDTSTVDYNSVFSVFPAEACETIGGEACWAGMFPEAKLQQQAKSSRPTVFGEHFDREYLEYTDPKTVFRGEACDDLGGEFCEYEYQKGVY
ncbi:light-regulated protein 1, chloroplastic [Morus notabilis]|uniref:light-regulated protein 1, chloroplastic n=1 Tax=Morus notabilis TaxID=981085 RepID=UPI000CED73AB|nr:light-regulated protein 1, chloroplastic [Morus notabilis]